MKATIEVKNERTIIKSEGHRYLLEGDAAMQFKLGDERWVLTRGIPSELKDYPAGDLLAELKRRGFDVSQAQQFEDRMTSLETTMSQWGAEKPRLKER